MPDWTSEMQQTFEHYLVDPGTWKDIKPINNVTSCTINRDATVETLGSAVVDMDESIGEAYIRTYLITVQNGVREKHPLGTHLVQTLASGFDGKMQDISVDAYTPLIELKENPPPLGYYIAKGDNIMDVAYRLVRDKVRAPVVKTDSGVTLHQDFVANTNDNWITFVSDLIRNAKYSLSLDEMGRILFAPEQDTASLQPVWTYTDDNSSILLQKMTINRDLYGIPNVVEVLHSTADRGLYWRIVNDDPNSPISTVNRGREIIYRDTSPSVADDATIEQIKDYAERLLRSLSTLECTVSYNHGYCPVRIGDCVRLEYKKYGITDIKAKVVSQSIKCETGCPVAETAVFTTKLWG